MLVTKNTNIANRTKIRKRGCTKVVDSFSDIVRNLSSIGHWEVIENIIAKFDPY